MSDVKPEASISSIVLSRIDTLSKRSEVLSETVASKLDQICIVVQLSPQEEIDDPDYPELFRYINERISTIERSLNVIEDVIGRTVL